MRSLEAPITPCLIADDEVKGHDYTRNVGHDDVSANESDVRRSLIHDAAPDSVAATDVQLSTETLARLGFRKPHLQDDIQPTVEDTGPTLAVPFDSEIDRFLSTITPHQYDHSSDTSRFNSPMSTIEEATKDEEAFSAKDLLELPHETKSIRSGPALEIDPQARQFLNEQRGNWTTCVACVAYGIPCDHDWPCGPCRSDETRCELIHCNNIGRGSECPQKRGEKCIYLHATRLAQIRAAAGDQHRFQEEVPYIYDPTTNHGWEGLPPAGCAKSKSDDSNSKHEAMRRAFPRRRILEGEGRHIRRKRFLRLYAPVTQHGPEPILPNGRMGDYYTYPPGPPMHEE